ncbi:SDR family oxidoreductase [Halosquirtibacter laminarini]|uniref:SDR family oxidoreductase n=1 Tax=Halosquirtibacter laminarini TaxID=3374600 RepID=A0AC61NQC5_9BACT|nr:SDR family oxidoreductase [Prolixibacteraceae bacterium]
MENKVVVITGASSGIGEALARTYSSKGAKIVLGARRQDRLEKLASELPSDVLCVATDVTKEEDCKNLINSAIDRFGRIDVLINNAGISMRAVFQDVQLDVLKNVMDVNFWGTVYCTKYALEHIVHSKGSIVGVISIAGYVGLPGRTGYAASKFAVRGFLDTVRIENMHKGVHVLVAAPGFTSSEIRTQALVEDGSKQGDTPRNESKMMSAERCAELIFNAVKRRKRTIIMTLVEGKFTVLLSKFFPKLLDRLTFNHMAKEPNSTFSK